MSTRLARPHSARYHARLLRRWQAQVAREMNEYEAARLAKLLEVPSDGRRF